MIDLTLRRYSHIPIMSVEEFGDLIDYAMNQEIEDKLYARWINGADQLMSFDAFKAELSGPKFKDDKEVLKDVENILNAMG